jgi:hypothetical protein
MTLQHTEIHRLHSESVGWRETASWIVACVSKRFSMGASDEEAVQVLPTERTETAPESSLSTEGKEWSPVRL